MKNDVLGSIKKLNQVLRQQQGNMSPDSNGKGHGKVLRLIAENEGLTAKELALMLDVSPPTLSEKVNGMEEDGIIVRKRDAADKRKMHLYLTEDGRMALERRCHGEGRFGKKFANILTEEEQTAFCSMCDRLIMAIKAMEREDEKRNQDDKLVDFYTEQKRRRRHAEKEHGDGEK